MIFNNSFSYKRNPFPSGGHPVSVIANFASDGRFKPIYFKYYDAECGYQTFKIDAVHYTRNKTDSILFCCSITLNNMKQEINLVYKLSECTWTLETP